MLRINSLTKIFILFAIILLSFDGNKKHSVIIMSDLHYDSTEVRKVVLDSVIQRLNEMEPSQKVAEINSVIVLGDITESGTEYQWKNFVSSFGLNGEAGLKYPVYEFAGNHDGNIDGIVRNGIRKRNPERNNITDISDNGLHYSWDIGDFHFVALGIYPGLEWDPDCEWCHYFNESFKDPEMSLAFLKKDLENNLSDKDQPLFLCFHYGWDDFSLLWWTKEEQERFYSVIKDYNVKGIFHGHDHAIEHYGWKGIDVWSAGSPQRGDKTGNFLVLTFGKDEMSVFEAGIDSIKVIKSE